VKNDYDGGEAILEALRRLKVDYGISSPGSEWPSFWEAMARQKRDGSPRPTYLDCGHEILAVTLAAAYTKIAGRMQAVLLHAGAGLLQVPWRSAQRGRWKYRCWSCRARPRAMARARSTRVHNGIAISAWSVDHNGCWNRW
jgi:hypothetical protein